MKGKRGWRTKERLRTLGKALVVMGCLCGFLYQTSKFFQMYLQYPTEVDIQVTSPQYIDLPSITICNTIGYNLRKFCKYFKWRTSACYASALSRYSEICRVFKFYCPNGKAPKSYATIGITKFSQGVTFDQNDIEVMKLDLEEYLTCYIEYAGKRENCRFKAKLGSFYSKYRFPNICYSLYNHWGEPKKQREKIPKGAVMKLRFQLNTTFAGPRDKEGEPTITLPASPLIQIGFHSPYFMPSPFIYGTSFIGGQKYEISLKQQEKHLLPAPYQTNCTEFKTDWLAEGGKNPVNIMSAFQKCKMEAYARQYGCVPTHIDYPHEYTICAQCGPYTMNDSHCKGDLDDDCASYVQKFSQPCEIISYDVAIKQKMLTITANMTHPSSPEPEILSRQILSRPCSYENTWKKECSTIDIDILFQDFEIHNLTYVPKYVVLQLFSVVGDYMGMWLGIAFAALYDVIELIARKLGPSVKKKKKTKRSVWIAKRKGKRVGDSFDHSEHWAF